MNRLGLTKEEFDALPVYRRPGLKDHEIAQLVNRVRDALAPHAETGCLRAVVSGAVVKYLEENDLRVDRQKPRG